MRVVVFTSGPQPKRIWSGVLAHLPRAGETLQLSSGDAETPTETVHSVHFMLDDDLAHVVLETWDEEGDYEGIEA